MSADLCFTTDSFFFFFLLFSSATLCVHWTELNQNWPYVRKWVQFETACPKSRVSHPVQIGGPKPTFYRRLRNLTASLTAYIFRMKHDIDNWASALTTTRDLLHRPKMSWTLVHKQLKMDRHFYPPYVNSAFYFIARLRRRRSNRTHPNFAKRWIVNRANNVP